MTCRKSNKPGEAFVRLACAIVCFRGLVNLRLR